MFLAVHFFSIINNKRAFRDLTITNRAWDDNRKFEIDKQCTVSQSNPRFAYSFVEPKIQLYSRAIEQFNCAKITFA